MSQPIEQAKSLVKKFDELKVLEVAVSPERLAWKFQYNNGIEKARNLCHSILRQILLSCAEEMRKGNIKIPEKVCINAESHLFGKCFDCEKNKGFNAAKSEDASLLENIAKELK